jgi:hypothetical protein
MGQAAGTHSYSFVQDSKGRETSLAGGTINVAPGPTQAAAHIQAGPKPATTSG